MFQRSISTVSIFLTWAAVCSTGNYSASWITWSLLFPAGWALAYRYFKARGYGINLGITYALFLLLCFSDALGFETADLNIILSYSAACLIFALSLTIICAQKRWLKAPFVIAINLLLTVGCSLIPIFYIVHSIVLDAPMSKAAIYATLASEPQEIMEFGRAYLSPLWLIPLVVSITALCWLLYRQVKKTQHTALIPCVVIGVASIILFATQFKVFRVYYFTAITVRDYRADVATFLETQAKFTSNEIEFAASKEAKDETYIVIIGESHNRQHMGLYGYERNNTPMLSALAETDNFLTFSSAYSPHSHTVECLSLSLTEANQLNKRNHFQSLSIINILRKAGIATTWITNHKILGPHNHLVASIAHGADELITLRGQVQNATRKKYLDGDAIEVCEQILSQKSNQTKLLFVHLYGNHWIYSERYPAEYAVYPMENEASPPKDLGNLSEKIVRRLHDYDNTVLYNDYVVASIMQLAEAEGGVSGVLYFSDHGEDVRGGTRHQASSFNYEMIQIPLVMWFSDAYRAKYPDRFSTLSQHRNELFCNDSIYDTLIGILNIQTEHCESSHDLSSPDYNLSLDNAYTFLGTIKYADISQEESSGSDAVNE